MAELRDLGAGDVPPPGPPEVRAQLETPYGVVNVVAVGSPRPGRPALLGWPDVGHTHASCFAPLFAHEEMQEIVKSFLLVHVDPPGMEEGAPPYPPGYQYPSLEQLAETVPCILEHFKIRSIIGLGVGAGAFILAKFGLMHPEAVEGLVLINIDPHAKGWMDWAAHKLSGLTSSSTEMILGHLFSQEELAADSALVQQRRRALTAAPNTPLYWAMYSSRRDLGLERGGDGPLKCPVLLVVGDGSPHEDAVVECNAKLDPTQTSFLKMADGGGQPQLTQPARLTEAFKYFVQGMGYIPNVPDRRLGPVASSCMTRLSRSRTASLSGGGDGSRGRSPSGGSEGGDGRLLKPPPPPPPRNPSGPPPPNPIPPPESDTPPNLDIPPKSRYSPPNLSHAPPNPMSSPKSRYPP